MLPDNKEIKTGLCRAALLQLLLLTTRQKAGDRGHGQTACKWFSLDINQEARKPLKKRYDEGNILNLHSLLVNG